MNLFADSSGWVALFDKSDKYHQIASASFRQLEGKPVSIETSDYIFDEALTILLKRSGHGAAARFGSWLLTTKNVNIIHIDEIIWQAAWEMFQAYDDKEWAFTDCTSFVLMRQQQLWQAFSFDQHFIQAGFQLWPTQQTN
jgi:predicted nucleic acid-binding protein